MGIHILRSEHTKSNITFSDLYIKLFCTFKWHSKLDWFCHCRSTERQRRFIQLMPVEMLDSRRRNPLQWFQVTKSVLLNWFRTGFCIEYQVATKKLVVFEDVHVGICVICLASSKWCMNLHWSTTEFDVRHLTSTTQRCITLV